ncbi:MAG: Com family DNA-binding transcriptional regulator [Pseudomonadota bacterium]
MFKAGLHAIADDIEIKCRRCGTINHLRPSEPVSKRLRERTSTRRQSCGSTSRT